MPPVELRRAAWFVAVGLVVVLVDLGLGAVQLAIDAVGVALVLIGLTTLRNGARSHDRPTAQGASALTTSGLWSLALLAWMAELVLVFVPEPLGSASASGWSGRTFGTGAASAALVGAAIGVLSLWALASLFARLVDDVGLRASWRRSAWLQPAVAVPAMVVAIWVAWREGAPMDGDTQVTGWPAGLLIVAVLVTLLAVIHVVISAVRTARRTRGNQPVS